MISKLYSLNPTFELVAVWTYRIIRSRYRQSVLGGLWAIIQPAAGVVIFSVIFVFFIPVDTGNIPYMLFSFAAMVPWTLFSSSIGDMADSLVGNMNLISKIYFPREVLPIAAMLARIVDFLIAGIVLAVLLYAYRMPIYGSGVLFLPLILCIQVLLGLGIGFLGAALNVFYRDVRHIIVLGLQIWFYATPIIYPVSTVPEELRPFYFINPMTGIISAYRTVLFDHAQPGGYLLYSAVIALVVFIGGLWFFKKVEFQFADVV
jgi:homopolymeric O-antigen transport system permease protein